MSDEERRDERTEPASEPAAEPKTNAAVPPPNQYVPGEKKKGLAEFFRIIKERRLLRRDLKRKGIKSREDFKILAESLGLVLWKSFPFFLWWHHLFGALATGFGLKMLAAGAATVLAGVFLVSTITEEKGSFTINLTNDMLEAGFVLSETSSFERELSRLFSEKPKALNNVTIEDIDRDVDNIDGPHNGDNYVAYTFYIKNRGEKNSTFSWELRMKSEVYGVTNATWIMVFEDGKQMTYTQAADKENNIPEELYGFDEPIPFADVAYDPSKYYSRFDEEEGGELYGIITTPYVSENIVAQGIIENTDPNEIHKYTIVIWLEGWDPQCVDDIFGGFAKFEMVFDYVGDNEELENLYGENEFYRTEVETDAPLVPDATLPPENGSDGESGNE